MNIALATVPTVWQDIRRNKILCEHDISISAAHGCDLIVFPEMTLTGFGKESAENINITKAYHFFLTLALLHRIHILFGYVRYEDGCYYNSATLCSDKGVELFTYDKIHPFSYAHEDEYISKGSYLCNAKIGDFSISPAICYDLRFPELYRTLSLRSHSIITIASWPQTREDHFSSLLKARAIENQIFSIGVNRGGEDNEGLSYSGIPYVYSPDGTLLEKTPLDTHLYSYSLEESVVAQERARFPIGTDRRDLLYEKWYKKK